MSHGVTQQKIIYHALRLLARRRALRHLPLHHPPGHHRSLPRDRVRPPQRPLRQPRTPVRPATTTPTAPATSWPAPPTTSTPSASSSARPSCTAPTPRLHRRRAALHDPHQPQAHLLRRRPAARWPPCWCSPSAQRIHRRFERIQAMFSDISAKAQENFSGARLIRAFAQEDAEIASFETANREYIGRSLHLVRLMAMLWPSLEFVLGLAPDDHAAGRRPRGRRSTASPSATSPPSTSTWSSSSGP